jgi:predicted PurR-regulated permease PerM
MQSGLNLSPVIGLVSLMIWTFLLGPIGALLAIPLTIAVRHVLAEEPSPSAG